MTDLVQSLHAQNVNVILWATSMIDTDSSNYEYALNNSYFVKNAFNEFSLLKWWHGQGGLLDYANPEALAYWHSLLDQVLATGIVSVTESSACLVF
jgi:alpha-glucosidase (family GH31 glycosyl hydrolase)